MDGIWSARLKRIAQGLLAVSAACLSLSGLLSAAGDHAGSQVLLGASLMTGLCFVINVSVMAFRIGR